MLITMQNNINQSKTNYFLVGLLNSGERAEAEDDEDEPGSTLTGLLQRSSKDLFFTGDLSSSAGNVEALFCW